MSRTFTLQIECGNAAFGDVAEHEVAALLRNVAKRLVGGEMSGKIRDTNGNSVGEYELEEAEEFEDDEITARDVLDQLSREEIIERLEAAGFQCYDSEPTQTLADALAEHLNTEGEYL
ncbi:hypothetical protein D9M68_822480 [compost metagenome]